MYNNHGRRHQNRHHLNHNTARREQSTFQPTAPTFEVSALFLDAVADTPCPKDHAVAGEPCWTVRPIALAGMPGAYQSWEGKHHAQAFCGARIEAAKVLRGGALRRSR